MLKRRKRHDSDSDDDAAADEDTAAHGKKILKREKELFREVRKAMVMSEPEESSDESEDLDVQRKN